jgi:hypothetical protein
MILIIFYGVKLIFPSKRLCGIVTVFVDPIERKGRRVAALAEQCSSIT